LDSANTQQLAIYQFTARWEQLDAQVDFIGGLSSSRALVSSSFVGHGDQALVRRDLERLERDWADRLGHVPEFVYASLSKLDDVSNRRDSGADMRQLRMVRPGRSSSWDHAVDVRGTRMIRREDGGSHRDGERDVRETRMVRRTIGGSLARRRQEISDDDSDDESEDHSRRRRRDDRRRSEDVEMRPGRQRGPLEHFLRETGAGLGATVGRGLDTLVREGKKEVTDFFLR